MKYMIMFHHSSQVAFTDLRAGVRRLLHALGHQGFVHINLATLYYVIVTIPMDYGVFSRRRMTRYV